MRVVVADDEAEIRAIVGEHLRHERMEVLEAVDGLEALRRIRECNPSVVVVVITGFGDTEVMRESLSLGARAVLSKPIDLVQLVHTLRGGGLLLSGAAAEREPVIVRTGTPIRAEDLVPERPARVLVVDDEAEIREMLVDFLEMKPIDFDYLGRRIETASTIRALEDSSG
jgi:CheY-like chemotaxis protein